MEFWVLSLINLLVVHRVNGLQCLNPQGKPVDWFLTYKVPELPHVKDVDEMLKEGYGHYYMDVHSPYWKLSKYSINSTYTSIYNTLQQIYGSKNGSIYYAMYNDQPPDKDPSLVHGHTKGTVAFDDKEGFWLVHSTPHFPYPKSKGFDWPDSALIYGQSFLCVTYRAEVFDEIGKQMVCNYPKFYDHSEINEMQNRFPNMAEALNEHRKPNIVKSVKHLPSAAGTLFTSFAKSQKFENDLYDDWIAPYYRSDMRTETWQNSGARLPSNCSANYKVFNIKNIILPGNIIFHNSKDHSKWGITSSGIVCVGDINRDKTQFKRNGGTVCFRNKHVWSSFNTSVQDIGICQLM